MKPLMPGAFTRAEYAYTRYVVKAPAGTLLSMVKSEAAYVHMRERLRHGDVLEIVAEDGAFDVELRVLVTHRRAPDGTKLIDLSFRVLREWTEGGYAETAPVEESGEPFKVSWGGPAQKFRVVENATGKVMVSGLLSKDEAEAAMRNLMQAKAA